MDSGGDTLQFHNERSDWFLWGCKLALKSREARDKYINKIVTVIFLENEILQKHIARFSVSSKYLK